MSLRRFAAAWLAITLSVAALVLPAGCASAATVVNVPGTGLLALRSGDIGAAADPGSYSTIVLNAWEAGRIPALKAANPDVRVLVYKDMSSTRSYAVRNGVDDALLPTGVGYAYADRNHPEWFLTDTTGARVEWKNFSGHWWMDIGNAGYQDAWVANVGAELRSARWDGVMVDNAMTSPIWYLTSGQTLAKYPNDSTYQAATESFLAKVGPALKDSGFAVVPNFGGNVPSMDMYKRWVGHVSGGLREFWGRWGGDGTAPLFTGWAWDHQMAQLEAVEAQGKQFLAVAYGRMDDTVGMTYARASFLLGWGGGRSALLWTPPSAATNPWSPNWTQDIGLPAGARVAVGGAWKRSFTGGIAVVNPSTSTVTVPLGATYLSGSTAVMSVTLPSATAAILTLPAGASAPTTSTTSTTVAPTTTTSTSTTSTTSTTAAPAPTTTTTSTTVAPAPTTTTATQTAAPSGGSVTSAASAPAAPAGTSDRRGYWVLGSDGGMFSFGDAAFHGSVPGLGIRTTTVTAAATPTGNGYWMLGDDGGIFTFGDAGYYGSVPGLHLRTKAIDLQATRTGNGYWILGADGGIFTFGDAAFYGSLPGVGARAKPIKLIPTVTGAGYWILGSDGGVFAFGDAPYFGSVPGLGIRATSVSMAPTPSGRGYWLLGSDGGIFTFGDAVYQGSVPGLGVRATGIQLRALRSATGYYVLGDDGRVFAFGAAPAFGSPPRIQARDLAVIG